MERSRATKLETELVSRVSLRLPALTMTVILGKLTQVRSERSEPGFGADPDSIGELAVGEGSADFEGVRYLSVRQLSEVGELAFAELEGVLLFGEVPGEGLFDKVAEGELEHIV